MKKYLRAVGMFTLISTSLFQSCKKSEFIPVTTDSTATNPIKIVLKNALPAKLKESSGLCYTDGCLWSFGDSGNPNSIYKTDTTTGSIIQTVTISNYPNTDWEDITADSGFIYIGDFGNNNGDRKDLKILKVNKADLKSSAVQLSVNAESINFTYSDQTDFTPNSNTNFDCEAVVAIDQQIYIFTKDGGDFKTRCYKLSKIQGNYSVAPYSTFESQGKITAAAFAPATKEIVLLGYMNQKIQSFMWLLNRYSSDQFFTGTTQRFNIGNQQDWQTEGIDFITNNELMMSCEGSTNHMASLYQIIKQ